VFSPVQSKAALKPEIRMSAKCPGTQDSLQN
jgi:hypothetical protein